VQGHSSSPGLWSSDPDPSWGNQCLMRDSWGVLSIACIGSIPHDATIQYRTDRAPASPLYGSPVCSGILSTKGTGASNIAYGRWLFCNYLTCNSWLAILDLQFLTCNSWLAILEWQFLTYNSWLAILDLQFLTGNSWMAILDLQFLTCNSWLAIIDLQFLTKQTNKQNSNHTYKLVERFDLIRKSDNEKLLRNICYTSRITIGFNKQKI
jgi:hypothetical protein